MGISSTLKVMQRNLLLPDVHGLQDFNTSQENKCKFKR